jgi:AraC-like DNA-binding protein
MELVQEAAAAAGRGWDDVVPAAPLTNRLAYLHRRLIAAMHEGADPAAVPSLVSDVLVEVLQGGARRRLHGGRQLAWYASRIDAARDLMERRYAEPLTIAALGREVGISPFHFSRIFRELTGVPPHRYLVGIRLRRAAEALRRGARVTAAGQDAGFANLGHFIRQFQRAHGVTPSRYRRTAAK